MGICSVESNNRIDLIKPNYRLDQKLQYVSRYLVLQADMSDSLAYLIVNMQRRNI